MDCLVMVITISPSQKLGKTHLFEKLVVEHWNLANCESAVGEIEEECPPSIRKVVGRRRLEVLEVEKRERKKKKGPLFSNASRA